MARSPDGTQLEPAMPPPAVLQGDEPAFALGLEKIIDRAMARLAPGEPFVYGIHQELPPRVAAHLVERYRQAGWREVSLKPGETGAFLLVLRP
jgi:hypothetical protein